MIKRNIILDLIDLDERIELAQKRLASFDPDNPILAEYQMELGRACFRRVESIRPWYQRAIGMKSPSVPFMDFDEEFNYSVTHRYIGYLGRVQAEFQTPFLNRKY